MADKTKPGKIENVILIGSGKGGVGKTTVSVNLALALTRKDRRVALLDADMYGPNVPLMLGLHRTKEADRWDASVPILTSHRRDSVPRVESIEKFGIRVMSAGFLIGDTQAVGIGSNMMVGKLVESLVYTVDWADSDVLLIDLPPGSDEPMNTIIETTAVDGGIIVTTPQDVARLDAQREIRRLRDLSTPVLGIVENMSYFVCAHCGERQEVFGRGERYRDLDVPALGEIPLDAETSALANKGRPLLSTDSDGATRKAFLDLADEVLKRLSDST